jgi:hypothetical protein
VLLASFKVLHPFLQVRRLCPNCSDSGFGKVASWPEQFVRRRRRRRRRGFGFQQQKIYRKKQLFLHCHDLCHTCIKIPKIYIQEICRLGYKRKKKQKKTQNKSDPLLLTSIILGFARSILLRTIRRFLCSNASCSSAFADDNGI